MWLNRLARRTPQSGGQRDGIGRTAALLDAGVSVESIHSFEVNPVLCDHLKLEHPQPHVNRDRAENFSRHKISDIKAVVSGLPLVSMVQDVQHRIVGTAFEHLRPGGFVIQFTYGPVPPVRKAIRGKLALRLTPSEKISGNVLPAISNSWWGNGRSTGHSVLTPSPERRGGWVFDGSVISYGGAVRSAITDVSVCISLRKTITFFWAR